MLHSLASLLQKMHRRERKLQIHYSASRSGLSRPTAGPGETFSQGTQTFSRGPSGEKIVNFTIQNGTFGRTLYFWPTAGPPKCRGAWGSLPSPIPPSQRVWSRLHACWISL